MQYICDFHIHSKYSRATSKETNIENLNKWARIKGVNVLATGDFTHPLWLKELKETLEPAENGLYKFKNHKSKAKNNNGFGLNGNHNHQPEVRFILNTEISSIYSKNGKTRKVHNLVFAPSFEVAEKINTHLGWIGNLKSDGRPILGLDCKELAKIVFNISPECMIIPAHAWTPWFSIFGSFSGFNSIEECFEEYTKNIFAIETGLSSDPEMNWRWSKLDKITLISNSDAHSPAKIGREVNILEGEEISYNLIKEAIKSGAYADNSSKLRMVKTIEFFPEEGKYHWDGHRNCDLCLEPEESLKYNNLCPRCGKPLTIGVMNRVCQLADRPAGEKPEKFIPFQRMIPLEEIIADVLGIGTGTKRVLAHYKNLIKGVGNEFKVLLSATKGEIVSSSMPEIAEAIERVRQGRISIQPGYDGEFGKISVFGENEERPKTRGGQETLF
ncbi:MAG: endonuclease Q family protein [bacterium]|nr:endonuclease Q family protein [bacterium]